MSLEKRLSDDELAKRIAHKQAEIALADFDLYDDKKFNKFEELCSELVKLKNQLCYNHNKDVFPH